ncbi:hypothetical protein Pmani_036575 [Petrolisthes manimaculis]|uniref:Uncharacterized protein n=1 Tax=Petrolisthes manimaculis TaxID=1843537 RepID=A0AAE1NJG6_9EUCA|nr:hypothetical protein Pmani_036575 [Petrolisthes manimaculis]
MKAKVRKDKKAETRQAGREKDIETEASQPASGPIIAMIQALASPLSLRATTKLTTLDPPQTILVLG